MSVIFYKFKIAKDSFDSAKFDGSGLSVWDLKREIIVAKKLGKGADFDLVLLNPQTNEGMLDGIVTWNGCWIVCGWTTEYDDDAFVVPKNTTVTVVRRPAQRAGRGSAQRYLGHNPTGGMGGGMGPGGGGAMGRRGMQQHHQQLQFQRMQQRHQEACVLFQPVVQCTQSTHWFASIKITERQLAQQLNRSPSQKAWRKRKRLMSCSSSRPLSGSRLRIKWCRKCLFYIL